MRIQTLQVSPITFGILKARGARGLAVSEEETAAAVRWAWQEHGLVVEPGAAVSLAALLAGKAEIVPETVVLVSGGNIDPALHARLVALAVGDPIFAGLDMGRRIALDRAGQLFQLGRERLQLGDQRLGIELGEVGRGVEQRVEHHRDARQDRLFDPLERLFETRLLLLDIAHGPQHGPDRVKKP